MVTQFPIIKVKLSTNTYIARCNGKTASATAGHDQAASALARKLWPTLTVKLARKQSGDSWEYSVVSSMMHTPGEHEHG